MTSCFDYILEELTYLSTNIAPNVNKNLCKHLGEGASYLGKNDVNQGLANNTCRLPDQKVNKAELTYLSKKLDLL